ncbi:MAG: hypothetical protein Q9199_000200 [Rusavskia elegans]
MTSAAVNRPTNVKQKEADVNQKLQLYGIYSAFANGKVPSNKQIDVALNSAIASKPLANPSSKLSPEGRHLVADLRDVIEQAKVLLLTKNEGNLLQDFSWQTRFVSGSGAQVPGAPIDKGTAQQHGNQALDGLLSDATILLRDIAGDAAQNAANRVNPSQDQLSQIDQAADDNTWHDVPDLSRDNLRNQAKSTYNKQKPLSRGDVQNVASGAADQSQTNEGIDPDQARQHGSQGLSQLRDQASANVPDETKDKAKNFRDRTTNYAKEKLPKERRDQSIFRLKKMIVEIQSHQDYQQAIETLLNLAEEYSGHGKNLSQQGAGTVKGAHGDTALTSAETDLRVRLGIANQHSSLLTQIKTLLERFANYTSADDMVDAVNAVYRDADKDPELKNWFKSINGYVRKCLKQQGFIMQDNATEEWNQLYDHGHFLLRERYRDHTNRVLDEIKFFGLQFDEDPMNKKFAASLQKLFTELGNDENGKPVFKAHLLKDLSQVIVPGIFESVRYVPIPRIEYSDPMIDAIVENLVIESDNLAPNSFEFGSDNYFRWGRKTVTNENKNKVMVSVSGVQMDLKDVSYYIHKKQGFPSIKDTGVMDIHMGGTGFSFKIAMETADKSDRQHFFKINRIDVDMKSLNIKLKQSKHKLLFNIFKPLLFAVVKPAISKVLEKLIKDQVHQLDGKAFEIHQEAERVARAAKNDPQNAPNIYNRYVNAAKTTLTKNKEQAQAATADKKTNVAMTQHDSMFQNIKLPGGISTKATEYKNLAAQGDKWESPVFSLGSAGETTNLPKASSVTRKPHQASSGGVRGPQNVQGGQSTLGQAQPSNQTRGFGNQVNEAFGNNQNQDYSLGKSGGMNGDYQTGGVSQGGYQAGGAPQGSYQAGGAPQGSLGQSGVSQSGHTTLGANNPVLSGLS